MSVCAELDIQNLRIDERTMAFYDDFYFGFGEFNRGKHYKWNPDAPETHNPHMLCLGESGSGKSRLLRQLVAYLQNKKKHVFVIDLHGDLGVEGENYLKFTARENLYGINPFEMELDEENGGPSAQRDEIVRQIKKSFMPNMGAMQEMTLKKLIMDTYAVKGIFENDPMTWDNDLPSISDMKQLLDDIRKRVHSGLSFDIIKEFQKHAKNARKFRAETRVMDEELETLTDKVLKESLEGKRKTVELKIEEIIRKLDDKWKEFRNFHLFGVGDDPDEDHIIDMEFYSQKDSIRALDNLNVYITTLDESGVFHSNKPPVRHGLNRFDISGLAHENQSFFADVLIQKVFRSKKLKGEYRHYADKSRGERCDTFIVIDEAKLLIDSKDKESPINILNRVVTEARKYGLGLLIFSQRANHYAAEMLSNIHAKVMLKINPSDVNITVKLLGLKEKAMFEKTERFGVALYNPLGGATFEPVALPWRE